MVSWLGEDKVRIGGCAIQRKPLPRKKTLGGVGQLVIVSVLLSVNPNPREIVSDGEVMS